MSPRPIWLIAAFLATRLAVLAIYSPELDKGDQAEYVRVAQSVIEHGASGYFDPPYRVQPGDYFPYYRGDRGDPDGIYNPIFWDPLYPAFVAGVFSLFGASTNAVRVVQILISLATMLLGMRVVRGIFPREERAAEIFGWFFVAYLPFAGYATRVMAETVDAFLLVALLAVATSLRVEKLGPFVGFGLLLGLSASIKSYFLQLLPLVMLLLAGLLWSSDTRRPLRIGLACALSLIGFALALSPTLVRNYNLTGGTLLISTKGPWNFWKDNNNFGLVTHDWRQPNVRVHRWLKHYYALGSTEAVSPNLKEVYEVPGELVREPCKMALPGFASCERNHAIGFILGDPLRFARRAAGKITNLWSPNNYIFSRAPEGPLAWHQNFRVPLPGWLRWVLQLEGIGLYVAAMSAFFGAMLLPIQTEGDRRTRALVVLWVAFLTFVVVAVGHGVTRFRLPFMVPIAMVASLGCARRREVLEILRSGRPAGPPGDAQGPSLWVRAPLFAAAAVWASIVLVRLPQLLAP